jgi:hypothetical protein
LVAIWYDLAPWTLLLPFALWWIHRNRLWQDRRMQLAIWWFAATIPTRAPKICGAFAPGFRQ